MAEPMDKHTLVAMLRADVARELATLTRAALDAREAATHEEARPENDKDTRAVEASYLAGAQAERVRDLTDTAQALADMVVRDFSPGDPAAASAVVTVACDGAVAHYLLAPRGGGLTAHWDGRVIQVATFASPLGRALAGCRVGDVVEVPRRGAVRDHEVLAVG